MAFTMSPNNGAGVAIITDPTGLIQTQANFITQYDYATQYRPDLLPQVHYADGKGSIVGMLRMIAGEGTFSSDMVQHGEMGRISGKLKNVAVTGNIFTSPTPHQLRPNMLLKISDGVKEVIAYVSSITSDTVFVALNTKVGAYGFTGNVDIIADFSNTWNKGTGTFEKGRQWNPVYRQNYPQIIKEVYEVNESDLAHTIWLDTPDGPRWANTEIENTNIIFDNLVEVTQFFGERLEAGSPAALAGAPLGLNGIIPTVKMYGNVATDYIQTVQDLRDIALRIKEQGIETKEYCFFGNHTQLNYFNDICSTVSPADVNAGSYGFFENKEEMKIFMDFSSIKVSGITFYFKPWDLLDNPVYMSGGKFDTTGVCYFGMPMGTKSVEGENGSRESKPYLSVKYRVKGDVNRKRKTKIFGLGGTPISEDVMRLELLTETTNQVVGANGFFVGTKI